MEEKRFKKWILAGIFAIIGGLLGWGLFLLEENTRFSLKCLFSGAFKYILIGVLIGIVGYLIFDNWWRLTLGEMKVTIPGIGDIKFLVNTEHQKVAWHLFIETSTRIATQPLADDEGFLREALDSLYNLFKLTRDTLKQMSPTIFMNPDLKGKETVEMFAFKMLNKEIRPFTSKWHPRLKKYEKEIEDTEKLESDWPDAKAFRKELKDLQKNLLPYAIGFGKIAKVPDMDEYLPKVKSEAEEAPHVE